MRWKYLTPRPPADLTRSGLLPALHALAARSAHRVEMTDGPELPPLSARLAATAYFVAAEAVTNVTKHARATRIRFQARRVGSRLLVTIVDDGIGGADMRGGAGLLGLHDRVAALVGRVVVDSPPGAGTSVHAELPLDAGEHGPAWRS